MPTKTECWKWSVEYWAGSAHYSVSPPTHAAVVSPTRKRMNRRMLILSPSCLATPATCSLTVISELFLTKPWSSRQCVWKKDRKSTRLNSSHLVISYAVFCLKKKKNSLPMHPLAFLTAFTCTLDPSFLLPPTTSSTGFCTVLGLLARPFLRAPSSTSAFRALS